LEKVSGDLFEQYPTVIREIIRGKSGVYALYKQRSLYYVGLASNLMGRLKTHLRDRHKRKWNRFSVYLTVHDDHMKELESLLLHISAPQGNRQAGRFARSKAYRKVLSALIRAEDDDKRAQLLGGMERRRVRSKANRSRGGDILRGVFDRRVSLKGWYKQREYRAALRRNGQIFLNRRLYESPSAAASAARGRPTNGWWFWHFKNEKGQWVRLRTLKR
jgi:hypothetical protein